MYRLPEHQSVTSAHSIGIHPHRLVIHSLQLVLQLGATLAELVMSQVIKTI